MVVRGHPLALAHAHAHAHWMEFPFGKRGPDEKPRSRKCGNGVFVKSSNVVRYFHVAGNRFTTTCSTPSSSR